jgi:predicted RNA-binding Zn ribbon-like protein
MTLSAAGERTQVLFAHDTEVALHAAAALVNTARRAREDLPDVAALDQFVAAWGWTGGRVRDQAELDAVRALRARLAAIWDMDTDEAAELVNQLLRERSALPQLVKHDGWDYHVHATSPEAPLADRMAVEAAMAFADVIRAGELARLRACAAEDCDDVHVDLSKNRSRRFCSVTCANRVNVAAYRQRGRQKLESR